MLRRLFLFFVLLSVYSFGQDATRYVSFSIDNINISENDSISSSSKAVIEKKIASYLKNQPAVSTTPFDMDIEFLVANTKKAEAGLSIIYISECNLILSVKNPENQGSFGVLTKKVIGNGNSEKEAAENAVSRIKSDDPKITEFITQTKEEILNYYSGNCDKIIQNSDRLAANKNYGQAYNNLSSILEGSTCYKTAKNKQREIYQKYQSEICGKIMKKAELEIAKRNYFQALDLLSVVEASSPCSPKAKSLISSMENKIAEKQKEELQLKMLEFQKASEPEKIKIIIVKESELEK